MPKTPSYRVAVMEYDGGEFTPAIVFENRGKKWLYTGASATRAAFIMAMVTNNGEVTDVEEVLNNLVYFYGYKAYSAVQIAKDGKLLTEDELPRPKEPSFMKDGVRNG